MIGGNIGNFLAITFILPLLTILGDRNAQKGRSLTVGLYAKITCFLILIAYVDIREKNISIGDKISFTQSLQPASGICHGY